MTMLNGTKEPKPMAELDARQQEILRLLWSAGRMSRWELHRQTGVNPNAVGVDVGALLNQGFIRECQSEAAGAGPPRLSLGVYSNLRPGGGLPRRSREGAAGTVRPQGK